MGSLPNGAGAVTGSGSSDVSLVVRAIPAPAGQVHGQEGKTDFHIEWHLQAPPWVPRNVS